MPDYATPVPKYWRRIGSYYRLEVSKCTKCGKAFYPPRIRCTCGSTEMIKLNLVDDGNFMLEDYTVLHLVPVDFEKQKPLIHGIINDVKHGLRLISQICDVLDVSKLRRGVDVEPVFRVVKRDGNIGIICYGTKFRPRESE